MDRDFIVRAIILFLLVSSGTFVISQICLP